MKNTEKKKREKEHSFFKYLKFIWKESKMLYLLGILFFPAFIAVNYLQIYLPKMVVQELEEKRSIVYMGVSIAILIALLMAATIVRVVMNSRIQYGSRNVTKKMQYDFSDKLLHVDYKYLEDKDFLAARNTLKRSLFGGRIGDADRPSYLEDFMPNLITLIAAAGTIAVYVFSLWRLSPWLILIVLILPINANFLNGAMKRQESLYAQKGSDNWQKMDYVNRKTEDFTMAKDVRLYSMDNWFGKLIDKYNKIGLSYKAKVLRRDAIADIINAILFTVYYGCFFACVLYRFWNGGISIADVVFYAGMGPALFNLLDKQFMRNIMMLSKITLEFKRYENFMNYGEDTGRKEIPVDPNAAYIQLEHVSFSYPGSDRKVLNDLNLTIQAKEKIAIVGVNGAGKTTLMKLICGLLHPTEGRILMNGVDMESMEAEERYCRFSCAFQDIQFLPLSIRDNITMQRCQTGAAASPSAPMSMDTSASTGVLESSGTTAAEMDARVWDCLEQAGVREAVEKLPDQLDTLMEKNINENATDFSGGQRQKLILARALYRDAGTLILDEPTAALDAIAENDIYEKYAKFSDHKTSFFVSHRLSSTRFCNRILLIDGGNVAEEGTHEELLKAGGLYEKMFTMQAKYYREEEEA